VIITDKLACYAAAKKEIMPSVQHRQHKGVNNRAENSHRPTRPRERIMRRFKSVGSDVPVSRHPALNLPVFCGGGDPHCAPHPSIGQSSQPPFVLTQALTWMFGYYGGVVIMSLAAARRSRIGARQTDSVGALPHGRSSFTVC
jgi:hypothetical protein